MSTFPPIADYAFLSDCENNCLVVPDGSIEWLSLPRPDSPSVFGALLDRRAVSFRLGPSNALVPDHRRYVPGTMVLETTWHTPSGWLVVNELFVVRPVPDEGRRPGYKRVPRVGAGVGTILRTATCISGFIALTWSGPPPTTQQAADADLESTVSYWREWLSTGTFPDHPWRPYLERSALTLKGLSYAPTGAIMAASATSLPETPGGARNWDYRYTWIRDTGFTLRALYRLGYDWEALEYFAFILDGVRGKDLENPFTASRARLPPVDPGPVGPCPIPVTSRVPHKRSQSDTYGECIAVGRGT